MKKIGVLPKVFCIIVIYFIQSSYGKERHIPADVKCSLNDSVCLTTQAENTVQELVAGIPELGIEKLDVLHIESVSLLVQDYFYNWTNIRVEGLKNAIIKNISLNKNVNIMRVSFETNLDVKVNFVVDGLLFNILPSHGTGKGRIVIKKVQMEILFVFDVVTDETGRKFMDIKTYYLYFEVAGGIHYDFTNLAPGADVEKGKVFLALCNENPKIAMATYGGPFMRKITDKIFEAVKIYMRSRSLI